nr:PREDICTED: protocadherin gamma-A12 isoform X1 [Latimeria chalumnae]|eukprot:XP_005995384.2 PREDICTED: protocadherin gamma-A12 isoform X1 [Latimeria chalumnae]
MEKGSIVGNIGNDLGLAIKDLSDRDIRIVSTTKEQYFIVNVKNGNLLLNEKIDRELICRHISQCILVFEIILENPMALYGGEVEIQDINDNSPRFPKQEIVLKINELTEPRTRFSFENAQDPDIGVNSLQNYQLSPSKYFSLRIHTNGDSQKYAELALEKALDREKDRVHLLTLTATDGGVPTRSGTVNIWVIVLDANDNAPTFTEDVYQVSLVENVSKFTVVIQVDATDTDEGSNGEVNYSFSKISETAREIFEIDAKTGKIIVTGNVDFEKAKYYEMEIKATDPGGLATYCKVLLKIIDINDNPPEIIIKSFSTPISEDCLPGTVVSLLNVNDHDSGANGQVTCAIDENLPFKLKSSFNNYYFLATDGTLDREKMSEYNITITATDNGVPPLTTSTALLLKVSDINDNLPVFNQISYTVYIRENNPPGSFISTVNATDVDWGQNARLIYSVIGNQIHGNPISSFITINPENGNIQALRSFDHEQFRDLQFQVNAQDSGSPPLSSNVTVKLFVLDQNDNAPEILYPSQTDSSSIEVAFRSAEPNSLITKVVAVDADSGQNAWLSYKLIKATEPNTFEVGLYTGEIRTTRLFLEKDAVKQTLIILVKDNGQPSLSTTVTLKILVANNFPEILPDLDRLSNEKDYTSNITLYLVISLAAVSFLFLCFITLLMVIKIRHWKSSKLFHSLNVRTTPNFPPCYSEVEDLRTFPHAYSYEVHLTTNSSKNELKFLKPCQQNAFERNSADVSEAELQRQELSNFSKEHHFLKEVRHWRSSRLFHSMNTKGTPYFPPCYSEADGFRTLPQTYSYEVHLTTNSNKNEFDFFKPSKQSAFEINSSDDIVQTELQRHVHDHNNISKEQHLLNKIPPNTDWRFSQGQRPGTSGSQPPTDEIAAWPSNQMDSERLQNMMAAAAAANEPSDGGSTMGAGTLGLSTRYGPQFTLQHVPDYRQNVYIPGSMSSLSNAGQQGGKKKKSGKKDKK